MIRQFIRLFPVLALLCIPGVAASADAAHAKHAGGSKQADPVMIARGRMGACFERGKATAEQLMSSAMGA